MKKTISLLLSIVMLFSITAGLNFSALASDEHYEVERNDSYAEADWIRVNSYIIGECGYNDNDYYKIEYKKDMPLEIKFSHDYSSYGEWIVDVQVYNQPGHFHRYKYDLYGDDNSSTVLLSEKLPDYGEVVIRVYSKDYYGYPDNVDYKIQVYEKVNKPSSFKVSTRNTTSLKLSWSKVSGVTGYQLQQKSGDNWKTKVTTTATSATLSKLTAGKSYSFRVRAYKTINGTKYYSSWKTLTTCTKPAKVTLSKLTAYSSGHKIKASWKKVSGYAGGYQIYWAKDKSFKKIVAKTTVSGQSKTSYTGKNFTKGKKYYVKVRAYKVVNGTKYYGSWSNVKSITCK